LDLAPFLILVLIRGPIRLANPVRQQEIPQADLNDQGQTGKPVVLVLLIMLTKAFGFDSYIDRCACCLRGKNRKTPEGHRPARSRRLITERQFLLDRLRCR